MAPRIDKKNFSNVTIKAGQTATLEAQYIAEPEPTQMWSTDNKPEVKEDERCKMTLEPTKVRIVITNAKRSDTGKYTIKLTNSSGSDTASCDLIILGLILVNFLF